MWSESSHRYVDSGPSWEGLQCNTRSVAALPVTGPGIPSRSYKVFHHWSLPLLDMVVHGEAILSNEDGCHPYWACGSSEKSQGTLRPSAARQLLVRLSLLIKLPAICKLGEVRSQGVIRVE